MRHETSRHWRGVCVAAQARASMVCVSGGNCRRVRGRPLPSQRGRRLERRRAEKHLQIGRHAQGVRQLGAMQGAAQRGVVAELGIADHGREREPRRAHLAQQRQGQPPLRLRTRTVRGNLRPRPLARRQPLFGQIQRRAQQPRPRPGPQRDGDRRLAIRHLAARAAVLPRHADRGRALLRKARAVENQHAGALRHHRAQPLPHRLGVPRRMRDEMLERLIRAGIAEARPHRFHRLAPTVAQHAGDIPPQRAALALTTEALFEQLQPRQQPPQPRRRGVIQHRDAAYRTRANCTMTSKVITREFHSGIRQSDKVVLAGC